MPPRRHIPELDGLRALAILPVLVTHLWSYPAGHWFNRFAAAGWVGVDLFFVLSGFLITRILLDTRDRPDYFHAFYTRRVRRIVPAYYLTLAAIFVALPLVSHTEGLQRARDAWPWFVGYASNIWLAQHGWQLFAVDVTWSLAVEEQFYLVWPLVVRAVSRTRLQWVCGALLVVCPLARWLLANHIGHAWLDLMMPFRMDSLAAGALLASVEPQMLGLSVVERRRVAIGTSIVVAAIIATISAGAFERTSFLVLSFGHSALALAGMGALAVRWRPLAWAPLRAIGRVSYGLYLYHPVVLMVIASGFAAIGISLNGISNILIVSVATFAGALVSHRWIETPALQWTPRRRVSASPALHVD